MLIEFPLSSQSTYRFITRSQRATSAGIINGGGGGGGQPCDSSTSACNSPIQSGRLSPTVSSSIAPTTRASPSSSLQQQQQQQPDIPPHLSKSPTAAGAVVHLGKTENGFAAAIGGVNDDMTNNSGRGVSVKPPPVTKTPGVAEDNNSINTTAATTTTTKIKKKSNALDLMNSQIPLSDENKASKTKAEATPPATTGSVSNSNPSNQTGLNTVAVVATTPAVISGNFPPHICFAIPLSVFRFSNKNRQST